MRFASKMFLSVAIISIVFGTRPAHCEALVDSEEVVCRIQNTVITQDGNKVVHPRELWRCGGEGNELLFGFIITGEADAEGNVYLLDRWLGTIHVIGPDGRFLQQLSRQGEGPGETKQPTDLTWLPDGKLGIIQPSPGRIVRIDREGNPVGDIVPNSVSAQEGQFGFLIEAAWRGGSLAYSGSHMNFKDGLIEKSNFLALCDLDTGVELSRVLEKKSSDDGRTDQKEIDNYWVNEGRWCLGPEGKIFIAPQRGGYSTSFRTTIPVHSGQTFQLIPDKDSTPLRTRIPVHSGHSCQFI